VCKYFSNPLDTSCVLVLVPKTKQRQKQSVVGIGIGTTLEFFFLEVIRSGVFGAGRGHSFQLDRLSSRRNRKGKGKERILLSSQDLGTDRPYQYHHISPGRLSLRHSVWLAAGQVALARGTQDSYSLNTRRREERRGVERRLPPHRHPHHRKKEREPYLQWRRPSSLPGRS